VGKQAYYLDPVENQWRGFLFDRDCMEDQTVVDHFRGTATRMRHDPETVEEGWQAARTVITSNAQHFLKYSASFQRRDNNTECRDCWGLLLIPNRGHDRAFALQKSGIARGVVINGNCLPWKAVAWANLCVSLERSGRIKVTRFERCVFCEREHPLIKEPWYQALPLAQSAVRPTSG
jgi:hypothetical protein